MKKSTQWDIAGIIGIVLGAWSLLAYHYFKQGFYIGKTLYYSATPEVFVYLSVFTMGFGFFSFVLGYMGEREKLSSQVPPPPFNPSFRKTASFCRYCGTQNTPNAVFCSKCGEKLT